MLLGREAAAKLLGYEVKLSPAEQGPAADAAPVAVLDECEQSHFGALPLRANVGRRIACTISGAAGHHMVGV